MGLYDDDEMGLGAMNRRASVGIQQQKPSSGLMGSPAARIGLGIATGGAVGGLAGATPNSAFSKGVGMYEAGNMVAGAFGPSDPMKGAKTISDNSKFQGLDNEYSKNMENA